MEPIGNNDELNQALAEFEAKSQADPSFQGSSEEAFSPPQSPENSTMVAKVMKYSGGLIKNGEQANYILLIFALLAFGISMYLFFG